MTPERLADLALLLAAGIDPAGGLRDLVEHRTPGVILPLGGGMDQSIAEKIDLLLRSPEARLISERARAANIPRSRAEEWWSDPADVAWEFALNAVTAAEDLARCPNCGVDPDDIVEPDPPHRELAGGRWEIYVGTCHACARTKTVRESLGEADEAAGAFVQLRPREPGGPFVNR